jgi:hypothetical protein
MGDRHVHGWVSHQFSGYSGVRLSLVARARQFSSFIVMVGRIVSADVFEPKYAMIVKDKDEVRIPLEVETIPSAKEFKVRFVRMSFATDTFPRTRSARCLLSSSDSQRAFAECSWRARCLGCAWCRSSRSWSGCCGCRTTR